MTVGIPPTCMVGLLGTGLPGDIEGVERHVGSPNLASRMTLPLHTVPEVHY